MAANNKKLDALISEQREALAKHRDLCQRNALQSLEGDAVFTSIALERADLKLAMYEAEAELEELNHKLRIALDRKDRLPNPHEIAKQAREALAEAEDLQRKALEARRRAHTLVRDAYERIREVGAKRQSEDLPNPAYPCPRETISVSLAALEAHTNDRPQYSKLGSLYQARVDQAEALARHQEWLAEREQEGVVQAERDRRMKQPGFGVG